MKLVTSWRDQTRTALQNRPRNITLEQVATESGLPLAWLRAFARNVSDEPGVCRVQTLYEYLTKKDS